MTDKKFIELLNLYVDGEIGAEDALRLEAEVGGNPERRRVHDQYCRMQKACSMLSVEPGGVGADADRAVVAFPARSAGHSLQVLAGVAAAACLVAAVHLRERGTEAVRVTNGAVEGAGQPRAVADTMDLSYAPDSMRPVFLARLPSAQSTQQVPSLFAMSDASPQIPQLNWIGDVHMAPVFSAADPNFLVDPKSDLKAAVLNDSQNGRDIQEAIEMTAFRFQR